MKINSILASLAGLAAASAAPAPAPATGYPEGTTVTVYSNGLPTELIPRATGLEKRGDAGVYLCTDRNFQGYCVHIVQPQYKCVNLGGDLNDLVSSLGPDGGSYCLFYGTPDCNDKEGHFGTFAPGFSDLSVPYNGQFNDLISSYKCE